MRQHPIPQNIMDVEFKLVGNLTLRQFAYVATGFGLAYLVFISTLPFFLKWPLTIALGVLGAALAFLPINDRSLDVWLFNFLKAIYHPQRRLWRKKPHLPPYLTLEGEILTRTNQRAASPDRRLTAYLHRRPQTTPNPAEELENQLLNQINSLIGEEMKTEKSVSPATPQTVTPPKRVAEKVPKTYASRINYAQENLIPIKVTAKDRYFKTPLTNTVPNRTLRVKPREKQTPLGFAPRPQKKTTLTRKHLKKVSQPPRSPQPEQPEPPEKTNQRNQVLLTEVKNVLQTLKKYNLSGPHPIIDPEAFPDLKESSLKKIAQSAKKIPSPTPGLTSNQPPKLKKPPSPPPSPEQQSQAQIETLKKQNEKILKKLETTHAALKQISQPPAAPSAQVPKPERPAPQKERETIIPKPFKTQHLTQQLIAQKQKAARKPQQTPTNQPSPKEVPSLTQQPNVLNGIVYDTQGGLLGNAIVLVKDEADTPKWAAKTNDVGQFIMSTPLNEGTYTIEVQKPGISFTPVTVTVDGGVIKPIIIKGTKA